MTPLLSIVVDMALLTWVCLMAASLIRAKGWTLPGFILALGNRDNMPEPGALAGRASRTASNTLENFALFSALAFVAHLSGSTDPRILTGAMLFFWARVVYIPVYYVGLAYVRTAVWGVSIAGMVMMIMGMAAK
jgi:uncharacterized MAPEG superfamily protein